MLRLPLDKGRESSKTERIQPLRMMTIHRYGQQWGLRRIFNGDRGKVRESEVLIQSLWT